MRRSGFTLIELLIVLLILNILAAIVIPKVANATTRSRYTSAATSMMIIADAAKRYRMEKGSWPGDVNRGQWPPDFADYLLNFNLAKTPVGGKWDWDYWPNGARNGVVAAVSILEIDDETMAGIDAVLDDGNLNTGMVWKNGDRLQYVLDHN
jgi:prepilin-type N-terminal cleavage/methylation domain-containing protein